MSEAIPLDGKEKLLMEIPINRASIIVPAVIKLSWLSLLIYLGFHYADIYNYAKTTYWPEFQKTDLYAQAIEFQRTQKMYFSLTLLAVAVAIVTLIWKTFRQAFKKSVSAATDCILLPLSVTRDLWFYTRALTDNRLVIRTGVISRTAREIPVRSINSMRIDKDLIGMVFNYGDIYVTDVHHQKYLLRQVSDPDTIAQSLKELCGTSVDESPVLVTQAPPADTAS